MPHKQPNSTSSEALIRENDDLRARLAVAEARLAEAQQLIQAIQQADGPLRSPGSFAGSVLTPADIIERERVAGALRESEERFRLAATATRAMVYDLDVRTGRVNSLNGLQGLLGYELSASDATLEWWDRQIHPDDLAMCHDAFALTLSDGKDQVLQYRVRHKDDRELWVDDHATVLRDSRGEIVRMVGTVVDITARKQAEVALRQSHAFVQSTIDALSSHICVLDQTGTIIAVNRAWRDFDEANRRADGDERDSASTPEGGNRAPINYLDVCEATVGADAADARKVAAGIRAILQGASQHFSLEYPCHSPAEQHWFLCRVTPYAGDGVPRIVRILALITAESELKQRTILNCLKAMAESGGLDLQFPRSCGQKLPHTDMGPLPCESKRQDYAHEMELMPQSAYSGSPIAVPRGNNAEWLFPQKNATSREIGKCM